MPLWVEKVFDMIPIFLNLLRLVNWPEIYPGEFSMWTWKEYVFCCFWMECFIYIKYIWSDVSFKASGSLSIFCLDDLSIDVSGVFMSIIVIENFYFYVC